MEPDSEEFRQHLREMGRALMGGVQEGMAEHEALQNMLRPAPPERTRWERALAFTTFWGHQVLELLYTAAVVAIAVRLWWR